MTGSRHRILDRIRRSLDRGPLPDTEQDRLRIRLSEPVQGIRPLFDHDPLERFVEKLEGVAGTVHRVAGVGDVPAAVQQYLDRHGLETRLVVSGDPVLEQVRWPSPWRVEKRAARSEDRVSVTGAFAAVAETGTVAFVSGNDNPTTLRFLPDDHVVVLGADQVVSHLEDLWWLLRRQVGEDPNAMPRTVNLVTGPSRTADVEQTIQLGAHGPRRLHVVLVEH